MARAPEKLLPPSLRPVKGMRTVSPVSEPGTKVSSDRAGLPVR